MPPTEWRGSPTGPRKAGSGGDTCGRFHRADRRSLGGAGEVGLLRSPPSIVGPRNGRAVRSLQWRGELKDGKTGSVDDVRVLFVEDDPAVAQMYRLKLELDGYQVEVAPDGELALQMARREPPDIIFLDIRLPKLGGLDVLEALRADPKTQKLPVVILSSSRASRSRG